MHPTAASECIIKTQKNCMILFPADVLKVQKALKKLGYFHDWPSGKFQDNLKKSVIKFQKKMQEEKSQSSQ